MFIDLFGGQEFTREWQMQDINKATAAPLHPFGAATALRWSPFRSLETQFTLKGRTRHRACILRSFSPPCCGGRVTT